MKKRIFSVLLIGLIFSACGNKEGQNHQKIAVQTVGVVRIPKKDIQTYNSYPTNMEGIVNVDVRAKISGYITDVLVDEGEKVHKGQLLFKLETHSLSEQASAAKANINAAQVQVDQLKPLVEKGIVSKSQLATAKARLAQAQSQYESVTANIGYSEIRSPVDGFVGEIRLRKGNLVNPSDPTPLTTISDIKNIYAYFSMNEADYLNFIEKAKGKTRAEKIKNLPKVTLIMANGQTYPEKGTIQTINSQIDPQTGSISFRAVFDNNNHILTNGSTGQIHVPKVYDSVLVVPQRSTFERQDKTFVMKIVKHGDTTKAVATTVEVENAVRGMYLVTSGVKEGDQIVAKDVDKLTDGTIIKTKEFVFDSIAKPLPVIFIK